MIDDSLLLRNAVAYADSRQISLQEKRRLGYGSDGSVWESTRHTAIKAVAFRKNYLTEVACYQRLLAAGVSHLGGFDIPLLEDFDDRLQVFEMSLVQPPYLLDFAKAYLDTPPPYWDDPRIRRESYEEWQERFESQWDDVAAVLSILQNRFGIYYVDPRPGNINPGD